MLEDAKSRKNSYFLQIIGLFFALLLLIVFLPLILSHFVIIAFNWLDLLIYGVVAFIIYLIIRGVGNSLDKKFNKSIQDFLDGKKEKILDDKGLLRTFAFLLIILLPFLLFLFALALFAAIDVGLYGFILISNLGIIDIRIPIALGVIIIGTAIAILIGLYYLFFPPKRKTLGITISHDEQEKLWDITKKIAIEIQTRPVDKIIITPDPGICVYLEGNIFSTIMGRGKRTLEIGLPSLYNLNIDEFKTILAHEYGHFSNRDTQWTPYTYSMGNSLMTALSNTPTISPAYWLLRLYANLYFKITKGFSRIREVMADVMALDLYGSEAFSNGLLKVAMNDLVFNEKMQQFVPEYLKNGQVIINFSKFLKLMYEQIEKDDRYKEHAEKVLFASNINNVYNSHLPLKTRLEYVRKFEVVKEKENEKVESIFENWDKLNERVAELYNSRLLDFLNALRLAQIKRERQFQEVRPIKKDSFNIKYCPVCGAKIKEDDNFCIGCGRKIIK
jgi:Zn-dependent protease with chaperone function